MCRDAATLFACLLGPASLYYYTLLRRRSRARRRRRRPRNLIYSWLEGFALSLNEHQETIIEQDTWLNCIMEANYDEDLSQNTFFQTLQHEHQSLFDRAIGESWIICVPRYGTFTKSTLTEEDFLGHILIPDDELPGTHFHTLTDKEIRLCNRTLNIEFEIGKPQSLKLLFEETFYRDDLNKYCVWCIEGLLQQDSNISRNEVPIVTSLKECVDLLWTEVLDKNILKELDASIEEFERHHKNLENECLQIQRDLVNMLYNKGLQILLKDTSLRERTNESRYFLQTVKVSTETYILHGLRRILPQAVAFSTAADDASLNKIIKNLHDLQLSDLSVRPDLYDGVSRGKLELSRLDGYFTVLGKIGCLKRVAQFISQGVISISSDDLLPILIFLVIKSGLANWCAQLTFMKQFRFSANSAHEADEAGFLVTSLEAAAEHVKSGSLRVGPAHSESDMVNGKTNQIKLTESDVENSNGLDMPIKMLFENIRKGNLSEVQRILSEKIQGASKEAKLCHPLCLCESCERNLSVDSESESSSVRTHDEHGLTCLHVASLHGQASIVDYLLERGADPNELDSEDATALHCAASRGHQNTLLLLLHANADPNAYDARGNTPLHLAADRGHDACVKALLYFAEQSRLVINVSPVNHQGDTPLHFASKWGYTGIVDILLEYGADPNSKNRRGQTPMTVSHSSHIARLLKGSSSRRSTPIGPSNYLAMLKETNSEGDNHTKKTNSAVSSANNFGYLSRFSDGMHKIDRLFAAVAEGDIRLASYYMGFEGPYRKIFISEQNEPKFCHPLCTCEKCISIEELSYERETKPPVAINAVNSTGETALHIASAVGANDIVQLLLDAGAKVNLATRSEGRTPLHLACVNDRVKAAKMLISCGSCNLNAKDNVRDTPLHLAARGGSVRIVEMLVRHGANTRLRNLEGATALEEIERIDSNNIFLSLALSNIAKILKSVNSSIASQ